MFTIAADWFYHLVVKKCRRNRQKNRAHAVLVRQTHAGHISNVLEFNIYLNPRVCFARYGEIRSEFEIDAIARGLAVIATNRGKSVARARKKYLKNLSIFAIRGPRHARKQPRSFFLEFSWLPRETALRRIPLPKGTEILRTKVMRNERVTLLSN